MENEEGRTETIHAPQTPSPKDTLKEPDTNRELIKESETNQELIKEPASEDILRDHIEISKEFIKDLELKTAQLSRQHRSSSGEYEEEKGQIERNENEKSSDQTDFGRRFFKKEKKRKSSEKENEKQQGKEDENKGTSQAESRTTPLGWTTHVDTETQLPCYIHSATGKKVPLLNFLNVFLVLICESFIGISKQQ